MPLTTSQVAKMLGLHEKSIARAAKLGVLKAQRFGRAYMFQLADLREYLVTHPRPSRVAHVDLHAL